MERELERNRMLEFSSNFADSLMYKIKQQAHIKGMEERHKTIGAMKAVRRKQLEVEGAQYGNRSGSVQTAKNKSGAAALSKQ